MRRAAFIVVAVIATGTGCGATDEFEPKSAPTGSTQVVEGPSIEATSSSASVTTVRATSNEETPTTPAPTATVEPTIYRPVPIREGDRVVALILPVEGIALDHSSVTLRIVELPDGRFLEADLASAVVPDNAAFWTTEINGTTRGKVTARQGGMVGLRVDRDLFGESFTVIFSATTADGEVLATTGDVQMTE